MHLKSINKKSLSNNNNKRESFLGLNISFPWGYKGKKYELLLSKFRNSITPSRKTINDLLKVYPKDIFNFYYLK